jgi:hypothetical protein
MVILPRRLPAEKRGSRIPRHWFAPTSLPSIIGWVICDYLAVRFDLAGSALQNQQNRTGPGHGLGGETHDAPTGRDTSGVALPFLRQLAGRWQSDAKP